MRWRRNYGTRLRLIRRPHWYGPRQRPTLRACNFFTHMSLYVSKSRVVSTTLFTGTGRAITQADGQLRAGAACRALSFVAAQSRQPNGAQERGTMRSADACQLSATFSHTCGTVSLYFPAVARAAWKSTEPVAVRARMLCVWRFETCANRRTPCWTPLRRAVSFHVFDFALPCLRCAQ